MPVAIYWHNVHNGKMFPGDSHGTSCLGMTINLYFWELGYYNYKSKEVGL